MYKKLVIILGLFLLLETAAAVILVSSFSVRTNQDLTERGPRVLGLSLPNFSKGLMLLGPEKENFILQNAAVDSWRNDAGAALPRKTNLAQYFFEANFPELITFESLLVDEEKLGEYLSDISEKINRPPQDAVLTMAGGRAAEFVPDKDGLLLDLKAAREELLWALANGKAEMKLPVSSQSPKVRLSHLNNLGINKLLARGQSDFSGSTAARIQNIKVGSSRFKGIIIKPGEEFSFNSHLGPIDAAHGYKPELVIKPEGTTPEFGGGLCQVSTTAFRAAFFAGLPITARRNHSFAVNYYKWISDDMPKSVGLDATIYVGAQDMKFINDTPGAILIWTSIEGKKLYFDFYGAPDGREILVDGPREYDHRPDGGVKATVTREVVQASGENIEATFNSRYVSPNLFPKVFEYPQTPTSTAQILN